MSVLLRIFFESFVCATTYRYAQKSPYDSALHCIFIRLTGPIASLPLITSRGSAVNLRIFRMPVR